MCTVLHFPVLSLLAALNNMAYGSFIFETAMLCTYKNDDLIIEENENGFFDVQVWCDEYQGWESHDLYNETELLSFVKEYYTPF